MTAFPESITHYFGALRDSRLERAVREPFALCLAAEPAAFFVAADDQAGVIGYIFAPARTDRIARVAALHGFVLRWFWRWVTRQYGFGLGPVRDLAVNKLGFLVHARRSGDAAALDSAAADPAVQARILSIAVNPAYQGLGVAGRLCELALARLDRMDVHPVRLEVRPQNERAVRLYTRLGFAAAGRMADSQGEWMIMLRG